MYIDSAGFTDPTYGCDYSDENFESKVIDG